VDDIERIVRSAREHVGVGVLLLKPYDKLEVLVGLRAVWPGAGTWSVPGGLVEEGETCEEAAIREVREETGIQVQRVHSLEDLYPKRVCCYPGWAWTSVFYAAIVGPNVVGECREPDECTGWGFFEWDRLPKALFMPFESFVHQVAGWELLQHILLLSPHCVPEA
jgi:8-oxo-dGTP diphosphatase